MKISELRLYPIKSCRGLSVDRATIEARGFAGDRRAMIVRPDGAALTQRSHPAMAQIVVALGDALNLTFAAASSGALDEAVEEGVEPLQAVIKKTAAAAHESPKPLTNSSHSV